MRYHWLESTLLLLSKVMVWKKEEKESRFFFGQQIRNRRHPDYFGFFRKQPLQSPSIRAGEDTGIQLRERIRLH